MGILQDRRFQRESEIMVQELPEERDAGRHVRIVGIVRAERRISNRQDRIGQIVPGIEEASFHAELLRLFSGFVGLRGERRKPWKHAAERIVLMTGMGWAGDMHRIRARGVSGCNRRGSHYAGSQQTCKHTRCEFAHVIRHDALLVLQALTVNRIEQEADHGWKDHKHTRKQRGAPLNRTEAVR